MATQTPLRLRSVVGLFMLYILAIMAAAFVLALVGITVTYLLGIKGEPRELFHWVDVGAPLAGLVAVLSIFANKRQYLPSVALPSKEVLFGALLLAYPLFLFQWMLGNLIHQSGVPNISMYKPDEFVVGPGLSSILYHWLSIGVIPAISEETLCRGFLQPAAIQKWGLHRGVWIVAIIFVAMHVNPTQILALIPSALVFGYLAWRCRTILPGMLIHGLNNTLVLVFATWTGYQSQEGWLIGAGIITALLAGYLFYQEARRSVAQPDAPLEAA